MLRKDPSAVDLTLADAAMPSKARKEAKHGVSALKSGNLKEARKSWMRLTNWRRRVLI